jgi:ATP-dependent helicase/nuclease subunit B
MAADCPELYLSLTMGEGEDPQGLWENSRQTARRLSRIGREAAGVAPKHIRFEETWRFKSPALKHLEAHILRPEKRWPHETPEDVRLFMALDPFEEITWVAAEICRLVREEGFRYRDILVVTRSWERYLPLVCPVLERFGIPYFWDAGEDIHIKPLISLTLLAAQIAAGGFRTADMLRLARSAALDMTAEGLGLLENYCYIWQIEGADWERDWKNHPDGLQTEFSEKDRIKLRRSTAAAFGLWRL